MNKILFILLTAWTISFTLQAQKDVADYFVDMPLYLIPTLESSYRMELVENYQTSGKDTVQNMFGTTVKLLSLDTLNQHIRLQATTNSKFEMQLFKQNNDTIIGIINTVCAPICSSYIKFFDTEWKEVMYKFPEYNYTNWLKKDNTSEQNELVAKLLKVNFIELSFNPKEQAVEVKNNSLEYLGEEDKSFVSKYLTDINLKILLDRIKKSK